MAFAVPRRQRPALANYDSQQMPNSNLSVVAQLWDRSIYVFTAPSQAIIMGKSKDTDWIFSSKAER